MRNKNDTLSQNEIMLLSSLNKPSSIITTPPIIKSLKGKHFLFSEYQANLMYRISQNEEDSTLFQDNVYADLVTKHLGNYSGIQESKVHKRYNINTNFDTIEIASPYYDQAKSSINRLFHSKIKQGCFEYEFVEEAKLLFRLFDPSELLYRQCKKPKYIDWLPAISQDDFFQFKDSNTLTNKFIQRENEFITLFEFGSQRKKEKHDKESPTCYFTVYSFLVKENTDFSFFNKPNGYALFNKNENIYNNELPKMLVDPNTFPIKTIKPLLEISANNFRERNDFFKSVPFFTIMEELGIETKSLLEILLQKDEYPISAFFWKGEYTNSRRRFKPISEGFTLKIKKNLFVEYLRKNKMVLCYDFSLRRSIDGYHIPESHMKWEYLNERIVPEL